MEYEVTNDEVWEKAEDISTLIKVPEDEDFEKARILYGRIRDLLDGYTGKKMNAFREIQEWRKIGKKMLSYMQFADKCCKNNIREVERVTNYSNDRSGQRWTDAEDEILIGMLCDGESTLIDISRTLGRSVAALSTRCSTLVGIERTRQKIQGKFEGKLNGLVVDGTIDGLLMKG